MTSIEPLPLTSPRWGELKHVYGPASDVPDLLRKIEGEEEVSFEDRSAYGTLCSSLYHQNDPDTGGFAAVPHLVRIASAKSGESRRRLLYLCGWIEAARFLKNPEMPKDLDAAYREALVRGAKMMASEAIDAPVSELSYVLAAIAAFRESRALAENILSMDQLVEAMREQDPDWPWPA